MSIFRVNQRLQYLPAHFLFLPALINALEERGACGWRMLSVDGGVGGAARSLDLAAADAAAAAAGPQAGLGLGDQRYFR